LTGDIIARPSEEVAALLRKAKRNDSWTDLLVEAAEARGVKIEYQRPKVGRPARDSLQEYFDQIHEARQKAQDEAASKSFLPEKTESQVYMDTYYRQIRRDKRLDDRNKMRAEVGLPPLTANDEDDET